MTGQRYRFELPALSRFLGSRRPFGPMCDRRARAYGHPALMRLLAVCAAAGIVFRFLHFQHRSISGLRRICLQPKGYCVHLPAIMSWSRGAGFLETPCLTGLCKPFLPDGAGAGPFFLFKLFCELPIFTSSGPLFSLPL